MHIYGQHMNFDNIVTQLESQISKTPSTFHRPTIGYHNLKFGNGVDIIMELFSHSLMNIIVVLDITQNFSRFVGMKYEKKYEEI